ncbi:unnamed protein product [Rotaria magnacalcarata]|uniref:Uncharacterized protein n=1 Tax=Rotaria magnacalcarata TaxID=392030 RepID=A0A814US23_9BILA|nr:unnamed protein product [Rotaria magnacalcarata]
MNSLLTDVEVTEPLQKKPDENKSDVKFYILCLVLLIILLIIPIVATIIGIHFRNECPVNLFLPVCLIVLGVINNFIDHTNSSNNYRYSLPK